MDTLKRSPANKSQLRIADGVLLRLRYAWCAFQWYFVRLVAQQEMLIAKTVSSSLIRGMSIS